MPTDKKEAVDSCVQQVEDNYLVAEEITSTNLFSMAKVTNTLRVISWCPNLIDEFNSRNPPLTQRQT
jgi:hypothetical protein